LGFASQACAAQADAFRYPSDVDHDVASGASPTNRGDVANDSLAVTRRLRAMEQAACADVPEADRDQGPFAHREWITGFELLRDRPYPKEMLQPAGVAVYLRATPGMTEEWLGRVLECHLAYHAIVGDRPSHRSSPLLVDDIRVALSSTGDGFRIAITSRDIAAAREVIGRTHAIVE
jgi:hypothetical protein